MQKLAPKQLAMISQQLSPTHQCSIRGFYSIANILLPSTQLEYVCNCTGAPVISSYCPSNIILPSCHVIILPSCQDESVFNCQCLFELNHPLDIKRRWQLTTILVKIGLWHFSLVTIVTQFRDFHKCPHSSVFKGVQLFQFFLLQNQPHIYV